MLVMPLNKMPVCMQLLRRFDLVHSGELLLQLREEVLTGGHEVRHVTYLPLLAPESLTVTGREIPREPQAPLLLFATESPWTL